MENLVDDTLVTTGTFYKQALPLFQEMMNRCSTKVKVDELCKIMRNRNMKHINAKDISSLYGRSQGSVLFDEDKRSKSNLPRHRFAYESKSKKVMNQVKINVTCFLFNKFIYDLFLE